MRCRRFPPTLAGTLAATLLAAPVARADEPPSPPPPGVQLSWVRGPGAETCPDRGTVAREVARRLGRDPFAGEPLRWLEATVAREDEHYRVRIYVRDGAGALLGERTLQSDAPGCESVSAAAALALAIAIDPEAALRAPPAPANNTTTTAPPPAPALPPPPAPPPPAPATQLEPVPVRPASSVAPTAPVAPAPALMPTPAHPDTPVAGALSLRIAGALGLLPVVAPGVDVEAGALRYQWFRASVGVIFLPEVRTASPDANFAFGFTAAWLRGCAALVHNPRAELLGCGGATLGAVHSVVYVRVPTGPGDRPWFGLSAGFRARVRVAGPLALEASLEALVPLTRYEFYVAGPTGTVFRQEPVAGIAQLGASLSIW